jgi:hypothetical protein
MNAKKEHSNMLGDFYCEQCDYLCCKISSWKQHLLTGKHHNANKMLKNANKIFFCKNCDAGFKHQSSLCRHKKKCITKMKENEKNEEKDEILNNEKLIIELLKQNSELQKSLIELSKDKNVIHNNTNNSHNKTFNLNFFLNETCKDALNITEFVSSIKPTLEDLEYTGRQGYVAGISNIILKKLNSLEEYIRPIHCCDLKREVLYIKDNNHWTKETEEKPILTKAIKVIANENIKNIQEWRGLNPECTDSESQKNNMYLKIVSNSMSGLDNDETEKNTNKIISNLAREVAILKWMPE